MLNITNIEMPTETIMGPLFTIKWVDMKGS